MLSALVFREEETLFLYFVNFSWDSIMEEITTSTPHAEEKREAARLAERTLVQPNTCATGTE